MIGAASSAPMPEGAEFGTIRSMGHFVSYGITPCTWYVVCSWLANVQSTHGQPTWSQGLAATGAIYVAMLMSWMCGYFLSPKRYGLRLTKSAIPRNAVRLRHGIVPGPPGQDGHVARSPEHSPRSGGNFLPHARTHCGEMHEHDCSQPSGVCVDTCHVRSTFQSRDIGVAPDRFIERPVSRTQRRVPPVDKQFVHIGRGPGVNGPPLYRGPRQRRYRRILHRVGGRRQRGGGTVSLGGRLAVRLAGAAHQ